MGAKEIATYFNNRNIKMRTQNWNRSRVHEVLCNRAYIGEYYFNKMNNKTKQLKPQSEWIKLAIPTIIELVVFEAARTRRSERSPKRVPPRLVNSPTLLIGLLKCANCGAGMTTVTGKGGKYRYYKCNKRIGVRNDFCTTPSLPMEKTDDLMLNLLADKVFTPYRVQTMMQEMQKRSQTESRDQSMKLKPLQKELESLKQSSERLYEAVEKGLLPLDESLHERFQKLKARRQEVLLEISKFNRKQEMPKDLLKKSNIDVFTKTLREKLLNKNSKFGKEYLKALVKEIRVNGNLAEVSGSYISLANAVMGTKKGTDISVPTFVSNWLPSSGSN